MEQTIRSAHDIRQQRSVRVLLVPFMGYTYLGERDGYMFVPDGNGALIHLNDKNGRFTNGYSQKIYGYNIGFRESEIISLLWARFKTVNDSACALAPVYGMVHTDTNFGYLAIIDEGAFDAAVEAYPNGAYTNYNWVTAKFR